MKKNTFQNLFRLSAIVVCTLSLSVSAWASTETSSIVICGSETSKEEDEIILNETRLMNEGDFCIISPFTQHSVLAAKDSLVLSIQLRKTTFDAIFGSFLAKTDLLAIFFKNTLYETNQSNYLYFHTDNNDNIKMLMQNIIILQILME